MRVVLMIVILGLLALIPLLIAVDRQVARLSPLERELEELERKVKQEAASALDERDRLWQRKMLLEAHLERARQIEGH